MSLARLGVNIDHVATLRQQRGEFYPELNRAAEISLAAGAHQITIHLREDRRHIQEKDVAVVHEICKKFKLPLNLEMAASIELLPMAKKYYPEWICLVPEKRQERTTEGGLDLISSENFNKLKTVCDDLKKQNPKTKISLFIEADLEVIKKSLDINADAVEIHTGEYARDFLEKKDLKSHLEKYAKAAHIIKKAKRGYHAGHGLTYESLKPLLESGYFEEYNIGHWIISESVFIGLGHVIKEMMTLINSYPLKENI